MDAPAKLHPTDQTLSSYGPGKLDERSRAKAADLPVNTVTAPAPAAPLPTPNSATLPIQAQRTAEPPVQAVQWERLIEFDSAENLAQGVAPLAPRRRRSRLGLQGALGGAAFCLVILSFTVITIGIPNDVMKMMATNDAPLKPQPHGIDPGHDQARRGVFRTETSKTARLTAEAKPPARSARVKPNDADTTPGPDPGARTTRGGPGAGKPESAAQLATETEPPSAPQPAAQEQPKAPQPEPSSPAERIKASGLHRQGEYYVHESEFRAAQKFREAAAAFNGFCDLFARSRSSNPGDTRQLNDELESRRKTCASLVSEVRELLDSTNVTYDALRKDKELKRDLGRLKLGPSPQIAKMGTQVAFAQRLLESPETMTTAMAAQASPGAEPLYQEPGELPLYVGPGGWGPVWGPGFVWGWGGRRFRQSAPTAGAQGFPGPRGVGLGAGGGMGLGAGGGMGRGGGGGHR
jgi:hypothetical protein